MNQENKGVKSNMNNTQKEEKQISVCCGYKSIEFTRRNKKVFGNSTEDYLACSKCKKEFIPQPSESKEECCEICIDAPKCDKNCPLRHFHCANCKCHKKVSESLEEKDDEIDFTKMHDATGDGTHNFKNTFIISTPKLSFYPPTDSNWITIFDKEFPACDCRNNLAPHFEDSKVNRNWIKGFIEQTLQQERQLEREKMIEEVEKLKLKSGKANRRGQHFINEDDYNDALDKVLDIIKNKE